MKNGVWVGGVILALVGSTPRLFGQESSPWTARAPQPVPSAVLSDLRPCPSVTLGKPIAVSTNSGPPAPAVLKPAGYSEPVTSPAIPSSSEWTDSGEKGDQGTDFAIDRPVPIAVTTAPADPSGLHLVGLSNDSSGGVVPALGIGATDSGAFRTAPVAEDVQYPKFYLSGEYLLWWVKQDKVPVLASTSSNPFDNGELGKPTTRVLFGGDGLDGSGRSGFRVTAGWWLDETCKDDAIEVSGFYLSPRATNFNANSSQFPVLARPFFNVNQGIEFAQLTAFPGVATGNLSVNDESKLFGAEINGRCNLCCGCNYRLDILGGFRFVDLEESLTITETGLFLPGEGPPNAGDRFLVNDFFSTRNQFYGGQIGLAGEYDWGRFSLEGWVKVALGDTHQDILIDGNQVLTAPNGTTQNFKGGLLALPSNIGRFSRDRFGVIPELNLNIGYQLTDHVRVFVGYDVLYWNDVVRAGGQIDRNLDITQIPNFPVPGVKPAGQNQPSAPQSGTDFSAQGVTVGLEIRY